MGGNEELNHAQPGRDLGLRCKANLYLNFPARSWQYPHPRAMGCEDQQGRSAHRMGPQAPEAEAWVVKRIVKDWAESEDNSSGNAVPLKKKKKKSC